MLLTITANRKAALLAVREGAFHRDGTRGPWYSAADGSSLTGAQTRALNDLVNARLVFTTRFDQANRFSSARVGRLTELGQRTLDLLGDAL